MPKLLGAFKDELIQLVLILSQELRHFKYWLLVIFISQNDRLWRYLNDLIVLSPLQIAIFNDLIILDIFEIE